MAAYWVAQDWGCSTRLCLWREREARRRNRPQSWIAKDNELQAIAEFCAGRDQAPDEQALKAVQGVNAKLLQYKGRALAEAMNSDENLPDIDTRALALPLQPAERKLLKQCQKRVQDKAGELGMAPELLARKRQLMALLRNCQNHVTPSFSGDLAGWRRDILEPLLADLLDCQDPA